ncbi:MAG: HAD family hydrolase [Vicinamibacterales bacterium]
MLTTTSLRPAVFLDRDGTLIEERGYLDRLDLLTLFPWTADALRLLTRAGFVTVVITNQSAIGRGVIDEPFLASVHAAIDAELALGGARIDRYYYCPHHPDAEVKAYRQVCRCRKPGAGMIEQACREMGLDPAQSVMVGDRWIDIRCGRAAGTRTVLVRTGHGGHEADNPPDDAASPNVAPGTVPMAADAILNNLMEAAGWILRASSR